MCPALQEVRACVLGKVPPPAGRRLYQSTERPLPPISPGIQLIKAQQGHSSPATASRLQVQIVSQHPASATCAYRPPNLQTYADLLLMAML